MKTSNVFSPSRSAPLKRKDRPLEDDPQRYTAEEIDGVRMNLYNTALRSPPKEADTAPINTPVRLLAEDVVRLTAKVCYYQTYELLLAAHQIRNMILNHIKREGETVNKKARRISVDKSPATPDTSGTSVAQLQGDSISQKQQPPKTNTNKRVTES